MSCVRPLPSLVRELSTYTTGAQYEPYTDWMPVIGLTLADFVLNLRNVTGNFGAKPYYQTAAVRGEKPDAPVVVTAGTTATTDDFHKFQESLSITDKLLIRFGVAYNNTSGTALGTGQCGLAINVKQCGRMVGTGVADVSPGMVTSTDLNYATLTRWLPAVGLQKLMAAFMVTDNASDYLEYMLVMRTAVDPRAPNGWVQVEASWTNPATSNTERNTGELSVPAGANLSSNMFYQLGVGFRKKASAGGNPRANIAAMVAARHD